MAAVIGALRVNLGLNSAEFEQGMKKAQGALGGISKAFAALGGIGLFAGFAAGVGAAVGRIEEMRKLTAQLDKALANTGNTANTSASEVEKFADRLERATGRAAEEVVAVSTNLATFGFSREVFYDAIKLADDMSAAWGGDLKQNAEGLARALADPEKGLAMLTKRGITFTDQQKAMIASFMQANNLLGAQGVVMDALNEQVKGVAEAGFGGLTKAQANATLALESFFETVANSLGVNMGLEMGLVAVAAALDFVTANIDVLARGAAVAGSAIAVALGPSIWAAVSSAAVAMSTTVVTAIRAIGVAIAANPIGLIITALAAAVTAAFLFRDEIKQAIGIDFVGIVGGAVNTVIGAFVGAFEAIRATWSALPAAMGDIIIRTANAIVKGIEGAINKATDLMNTFIGGVNEKLGAIGVNIATVGKVEFAGFANPFEGASADVGAMATAAFSGAQADYIGQIGAAFGGVGDMAAGATSDIAALADGLGGGGGDGGSGGGGGGGLSGAAKSAGDAMKKLADEGRAVFNATRTSAEKYAIEIERLNRLLQAGAINQDTYNRAVIQAQEAFNTVGELGKQVTSTLQSDFADMFKGLLRGTTSAMDAISGLLGKLSDLFIDQAFNMLFSGMGGGLGGGLGGMLGGIGKLFGFARGGTIMPGGSGGIDSQLVAFRKSPNERVDITKPGQTLTSGGGSIAVDVRVDVQNGNLVPLVTQVSGQVAGQQIKQNNKQIPSIMRDANQRMG